ncbi:hypothetical protein KA005_53135, partial [bacterium]|nr:hypothetical protein [bacterium]
GVEMKLKTIFTVNYIYAFLFGAGFIFFPTLCSSLVGFNVAGDSFLIARCMGIFVICTGVLTFFARDTARSPARRAIVISLFTLYILLFLYKVLLNLVYGMSFNLMFALIYILHIGFIVTYGYHLFGKPREIES